MNKIFLIISFLIQQFLFGQTYEQNIADYDSLSVLNLPHEESEEFINFYEAKSNTELVDAIFDIATLGDADFAVYY